MALPSLPLKVITLLPPTILFPFLRKSKDCLTSFAVFQIVFTFSDGAKIRLLVTDTFGPSAIVVQSLWSSSNISPFLEVWTKILFGEQKEGFLASLIASLMHMNLGSSIHNPSLFLPFPNGVGLGEVGFLEHVGKIICLGRSD